MSFLYILEIDPLSVVSFAIIFCHSEGCLFTLLIFSFVVQKLLEYPAVICQRVFCLCSPLGVLYSFWSYI